MVPSAFYVDAWDTGFSSNSWYSPISSKANEAKPDLFDLGFVNKSYDCALDCVGSHLED